MLPDSHNQPFSEGEGRILSRSPQQLNPPAFAGGAPNTGLDASNNPLYIAPSSRDNGSGYSLLEHTMHKSGFTLST